MISSLEIFPSLIKSHEVPNHFPGPWESIMLSDCYPAKSHTVFFFVLQIRWDPTYREGSLLYSPKISPQ